MIKKIPLSIHLHPYFYLSFYRDFDLITLHLHLSKSLHGYGFMITKMTRDSQDLSRCTPCLFSSPKIGKTITTRNSFRRLFRVAVVRIPRIPTSQRGACNRCSHVAPSRDRRRPTVSSAAATAERGHRRRGRRRSRLHGHVPLLPAALKEEAAGQEVRERSPRRLVVAVVTVSPCGFRRRCCRGRDADAARR